MNRNKSIIRRLIPWLTIVIALAALVIFVFIPIYSEKDISTGREQELIFYEGDGKPVTIENDRLLLEMDGNTTQFSITGKESGKTWYSNPPERDKDPIAHGVNSDLLSSTVTLTYMTSAGETEINNYKDSMVNRNFRITRESDTSILVDYAIGKIEREFIIPTAITAERYNAYTEKMSKMDRKKVASFYTLIDEKKLNEADNRDELIATYPNIETTPLYILKSDTDSKGKEKLEGYFAKIEYSREDYETDEQEVTEKTANNGPYFNVSVRYRLEGNDLVVEVPYSSVTYDIQFPLVYVSLLPAFGAGGADQEGFILLPEGSGGIIRYNNGKLDQNAYNADFYGWDYGRERTETSNETENAFCVFGMSQEDGSFICMNEGAASYGTIYADISGRLNSYNTVYCKYNLLHYGRFKLSGRTNELVPMYENEIPDDTVVQRYRFLEDNTYVGMAEAYGNYLRARDEFRGERADTEVPVNVELVGAINKTVPKMGMPVDSVVATTTFAEGEGILEELTDAGITNLSIRMTGWSNGGVRQRVLSSVHTLGELGGDGGMKKLIEAAKAKNTSLYFDGISCFAYDSGLFNGFIPSLHAAKFATRDLAKLYPFDIVTFQQREWSDPYYLIKPKISAEYAENLTNALVSRNAAGIAFRDLGNLLSADYNYKDTVTREEVKAMNVASLQKAREKGLKVSIREGNDYALPYADLITDLMLSGNKYTIIDEMVPFYEIAIHGMKNYTGEAINLEGDYQTALLECAEYGAGLNFTFMKTDTNILQDSAYSCYTGASWDRWKEQLIPTMKRYQTEMSGLNGLRMTGHEKADKDVCVTTYEDGTKVWVNYGDEDFRQNGTVVPARDYLVERGVAQ
ncbi:MAG: hypothetical protein IJU38_06040 [Clostridia bacterium]|nr:hypothetical protein [Clostridia bacterium]